uniref:60S ribosomal protein L5, putative n=1 Tax=Entamoeba invadens TaxID=33085 RepID=S0B350_ENTIV|nr:60S ribosomal protein L5, putative [Entamoeba invadens]
MGYLKVVKNRAYFKKYQTKMRRRREGKTGYYARRKMIFQDKDKYRTPKYRLIVRITNKNVIAQVAHSEIVGDKIICAAYSYELAKYGITLGLTNYAACYATGLLMARRLLQKLNLDKTFVGVSDAKKIGEDFTQEEVKERRPFKCILDVGLARTTTGARIFAVMKGMCDGGVYVPHSPSRFVGAGENDKALRGRILGAHVASYMKHLSEENADLYKKQFGRFIKAGISPDSLEKMYLEAHKKIRENPAAAKHDAKKEYKKRPQNKKLTLEQRKANIQAKLAKIAEQEKKE